MRRHSIRLHAVILAFVVFAVGCGGGGGGDGTSYGDHVATITLGGDCARSWERGADVEQFGRNVIITFYTPDDFGDCVGGYGWNWDGNQDTGMEQFVAGPCFLGVAVDFPPQDVLPVENRAFSSIRDNGNGSFTIYDGTGAMENSQLSGYVCQGPLTVEIRPR